MRFLAVKIVNPMSRLRRIAAAILLSSGAGQTAIAADADNDGVEDTLDECAQTAQVPKAPAGSKYEAVYVEARLSSEQRSYPVDETGCEPDDDGDGVVNSADFCPDDTAATLPAGVAENGCPLQSDGDGTPDYRDRCPGTARGVSADSFGCPVGGVNAVGVTEATVGAPG